MDLLLLPVHINSVYKYWGMNTIYSVIPPFFSQFQSKPGVKEKNPGIISVGYLCGQCHLVKTHLVNIVLAVLGGYW
jgi:hypothetical protein